MNVKEKFAVAAAVATLAMSIMATPSSASPLQTGSQASAGSKAACEVQHYFYTVEYARRVDLTNECTYTRYVCINKPVSADSGPHAVAGRSTRTVSYATWPEPTANGVYYAASSTRC
ncbi:hypothetical protein ACIBG7_43350 [Nonomuraea sp. NPDC050328]|uniref:hypothetical protein n=1 Tax=Nonomuraea sp. NPDC050328 TaxID=3364361 RepID=UPI00378D458F